MKLRWAGPHVPLAATAAVCGLLYSAAALRYPGFCSWAVFVNLLQDNAVLGIAALGMSFVILSGGIDLSVGAQVGLTSILLGTLTTRYGWHPLAAIPLVLALGAAFGTGLGSVIHFFRLPPFLVTLAGMFLARGTAFLVGVEAVSISHGVYDRISDFSFRVFPATALLFLAALAVALYVAHFTRFGRAVYALGGSESSALLMGLPIGKIKIGVYTTSGLCSAAGGVLYTFYTSSGKAAAGELLELDAIAVVVIGGTLLTGGIGYVFGTLLGVLLYGIIQTAIIFEGTLNSWWTKIAIAALLLASIMAQNLASAGPREPRSMTSV